MNKYLFIVLVVVEATAGVHPQTEESKPLKYGHGAEEERTEGNEPRHSGYPRPQEGLSGHNNGYPRLQEGYNGYPRPQEGLTGNNNGYPRPQEGFSYNHQGFANSHNHYPRPQEGLPNHQNFGPSNGYPRPQEGFSSSHQGSAYGHSQSHYQRPQEALYGQQAFGYGPSNHPRPHDNSYSLQDLGNSVTQGLIDPIEVGGSGSLVVSLPLPVVSLPVGEYPTYQVHSQYGSPPGRYPHNPHSSLPHGGYPQGYSNPAVQAGYSATRYQGNNRHGHYGYQTHGY